MTETRSPLTQPPAAGSLRTGRKMWLIWESSAAAGSKGRRAGDGHACDIRTK